MASKKNIQTGAVVAGIAGLTAAAIGAYYLYGHKDAHKNRAKVKSWMLKAKGEVLEQFENAESVTESAYTSALDAVVSKYNQLKKADPEEIADFVNHMKDTWKDISGVVTEISSTKKPRKAPKKSHK